LVELTLAAKWASGCVPESELETVPLPELPLQSISVRKLAGELTWGSVEEWEPELPLMLVPPLVQEPVLALASQLEPALMSAT
jgi:hypothetical protein